jgi:hypothetical protein
MIIYNKEWLDNLAIVKAAKRWLKQEIISKEEYAKVVNTYPPEYKESNIFLRIGMFIFTLIIGGSAFGLFSLVIFSGSNENSLSGVLLLYSIVFYAGAEYFVRTRHHFRSGVVDALLYSGILSFSFALVIIISGNRTNFDLDPVFYYISILPLIVFAAWRFADAFLALAAFACIIVINALLVFKIGSTGKMVLPFESMGISYLCYFIIQKRKAMENLRYWKNCFDVLEIASLVMLYLSGNYMVIRVLTGALLDRDLQPGEDIGLAPFFYAFTILVPLVYLWLGLKRRSYLFLRLGLLLEVAGILAIKYYHSFMPPETALSLAGIALILIAYFCLQYLKTPKHGITLEAGEHNDKHAALANIANIAVSQVISNQGHPQADQNTTEFGGGDFGGGGAGADF